MTMKKLERMELSTVHDQLSGKDMRGKIARHVWIFHHLCGKVKNASILQQQIIRQDALFWRYTRPFRTQPYERANIGELPY